jgi:hypothetical protein
MPGAFTPGQLRTLQRRVKQWRSEIARQLVLGLECQADMHGDMPLPAPPSTPKGCAHDQPAGFQIDQAQRDNGIRASALQSPASTKWKGPISGLLPDSPWRRTRRLSREFGTQHFPLLRVRRRRNRGGLRCCDRGLLFVRGSAKAAGHDLVVDTVELDTEWEGTGYGKKRKFLHP